VSKSWYIEKSETVEVDVDVDVDITEDDIIDALSVADIKALLKKKIERGGEVSVGPSANRLSQLMLSELSAAVDGQPNTLPSVLSAVFMHLCDGDGFEAVSMAAEVERHARSLGGGL